MCGIAGFTGKENRKIIEEMTRTLTHRGPDDEGFFVSENINLGMRRLSIIDVKGGKQPIFNEDRKLAIVFNGEIYNFLELKKDLSKRGHKFKTNTDTEVLVHLYEEKGEDFLNSLNGMFALALWDIKEQKLILARDRMGEKPIYYLINNRDIIFGSELKAILKNPAVKKDLDFQSLAKYLFYEYVPAPHTILQNIYKLGPGEFLVFKNGDFKIKKYWDISFKKGPQLTIKTAIEELDSKINDSVKMRLISDVPLGIFLSGGIDSSTITYYAQKNSSQRIKTFSISFEDRSFDESSYAKQVANFLGTDHYEQKLEPQECLNLIPQITEFLDEPLADASVIPTYLLSKFTKNQVTVALGGDGADELFMGYSTFQAHKLAGYYQKTPKFFRKKMFEPLVNSLPSFLNNISFDFKLKKFISGLDYSPEYRNQIWLGSFSPVVLKDLLLTQTESVDCFEDIKNYLNGLGKESLENRLIYLYLKNYLQDDILVKTDRASMAASLEVRAPFLDHHLVDFVNFLPNNYKLHGWQTKYILKQLMKNKLPKNIINRPKKGFGIPLARWIRKELKDFTLELLNEKIIKEQGIFNYSFVEKLLDEHFKGRKDNRKPLWTLMVFQMWYNNWLK